VLAEVYCTFMIFSPGLNFEFLSTRTWQQRCVDALFLHPAYCIELIVRELKVVCLRPCDNFSVFCLLAKQHSF